MTLLWPYVLLLLPLCFWMVLKPRKHDSVGVPSLGLWTSIGSGRSKWAWMPPWLRVLALVFLIVALARPQGGESHNVEMSEGIAIALLVDVSSSMDMTMRLPDGSSVSRMEAAKEMVTRFIAGDGDSLDGRPEDLICLITFARYADTRSPLTFGHEALVQIVSGLKVQERPNEDGTAYGDALALAAARLKHIEEMEMKNIDASEIKSRVIVLLTDGENNSGNHLPLEAAGLAKNWDCKIYAVSLGDGHTGEGNARLNSSEQVLRHICEETGGIFRTVNDYESLLSVYEEIDRLERAEISSRSFTIVSEYFWLPLAMSLLLFLLALFLESTVFRIAP